MNMFKTTTAKTPQEYLAGMDETRRADMQKLYDFIRETVPDLEPFIISGMIGFGKFHYKSKSGREGDWCRVGLANHKTGISIYVCAVDGGGYIAEQYKKELAPAKVGKSCIRYKKISEVDWEVLGKVLKVGAKAGFGF
jgi:hypothetical protein